MPLTIKDIRNPARKSGFDHVSSGGGRFARGSHRGGQPWKAVVRPGKRGASDAEYNGPRRGSPAEAAQDYCDYVNGSTTTAPATLKRPQRSKPQQTRRVVSKREREARQVIREETAKNPPPPLHKPLCYLIGVKGDDFAVKVGYADYNVHSRLDSLQTGNPRELILLGQLPGGKKTEARLHAKYSKWNVLGEWFWPAAALIAEFGLSMGDFYVKIGERKILP